MNWQNVETEMNQFKKAINFIADLGITVRYDVLTHTTFLPGISIQKGSIVIDLQKLKYPGDVLHEAGHLAVVPSIDRLHLSEADIETRKDRAAEEMMAIAWSYAACIYLNIDASFVFHDGGYQAGGSDILNNFNEGRYFGVPMLQWTGMTLEKANEQYPNGPIYPQMQSWLRS